MHPTNLLQVWVVEDNDRFRQTVADVLDGSERLSCAHTFGSCEALFDRLDESFAPDVIFMDIGLPGMSGVDGVRRLRSIAPRTQIVMLTVHEDNDTIFEALCAGAVGYLVKNARSEKILAAAIEAAKGGTVMSSSIARRVLNMFVQLNAPKEDPGLTSKEREVLEKLVDGLSTKGIAKALTISTHTVDSHVRNIYAKLHVNSRSSVVAKAIRERLV